MSRLRRPVLTVGCLLALVLQLTGAHAATSDPRWVFYTRDTHAYSSPWFAGKHRIMIHYGCTRAPYYSPDPRCARGNGFHHGIDIAMPCGTKLYAARRGRRVSSAGFGPAYGVNPLVLRNRRLGVDILLAHARVTYPRVGEQVRRGDVIALASDSAAPDGCHLHFEVRRLGGGLTQALPPRSLLKLSR